MKSDLHIHTNYSGDGGSPPKEIVDTAIQKGIECIAITDHNTIQGAKEAYLYASDKNILVIPGIEITSRDGHILGLNLKSNIPKGLSAEQTISEIRKQNGTVIIPHPFSMLTKYKKIIEILDKVDAIEVLNATATNKQNKKAIAFANYNYMPVSAGSDAHRASFLGQAFIESEKISNGDELIKRIKNGKIKVSDEKIKEIRKKAEQGIMAFYKVKRTLSGSYIRIFKTEHKTAPSKRSFFEYPYT